MRAMMLAVMVAGAALAAGAGQDEWIAGAAPVDPAYEWQFVAASPITDRDWVSVGAAWIFDDADRSTRHVETTTRQEVTRETVTNPETGEQTTTEHVVDIPETTETIIPGDEWDGPGVYAVTPIWTFAAGSINAGVVMPASDVSTYWPSAGGSWTFKGLETANYVFSSVQIGGLLIFDEVTMYALTVGLVW